MNELDHVKVLQYQTTQLLYTPVDHRLVPEYHSPMACTLEHIYSKAELTFYTLCTNDPLLVQVRDLASIACTCIICIKYHLQ